MSSPKDTNLTVRHEFGNLIAPIVKRISKCKGRKNVYPSFTPLINSISVTFSIAGIYTVAYITGSNFLPPSNGDTYVNFGSYTHLPIIFYSSFNISFIVPLNAPIGVYNITLVNVYNDNFSLPVSQSYPGIPNYSNSISYTIYDSYYFQFGSYFVLDSYLVKGKYIISQNLNYNNIVTFTGNGQIEFLKNTNNNYKNINFTIMFGTKSIINGNISRNINNNVLWNTVIVPEDISNTNPGIPIGLTNYPGTIVNATNANNTGSFKIIFYFNK